MIPVFLRGMIAGLPMRLVGAHPRLLEFQDAAAHAVRRRSGGRNTRARQQPRQCLHVGEVKTPSGHMIAVFCHADKPHDLATTKATRVAS
jgi:hypothetical protein